MLFLLVGLAFQTAAPPPSDPAVFLEFFRRTAGQSDTPKSGTINGSSTVVVLPSISESLGITHEEAASIIQIASLCTTEVNRLDVDSREIVFEARLQNADGRKPSDDVAAKLHEYEARRVTIVLGYVQQMKAALGDEIFQRVAKKIS